jgi:ADP-heptose:LPS heptosyltransferase
MKERIIINFPTNIGDTILAFPVLERIRSFYPDARITVMASQNTKEFLLRNSCIDDVLLFDKRWKFRQKKRFAFSLRGRYDIVIDLKNTFLPFVIGGRWHTSFIRIFGKNTHSKDRYLKLVNKFKRVFYIEKCNVVPDREEWEELKMQPKYIFFACSARSRLKSYSKEYIRMVVRQLRIDLSFVFLGEEKDRDFYGDVLEEEKVVDLVGKTTMADAFYLLKKYCKLLIAVDSSLLHIGSYLNLPIVALFGPTSPARYGPYSEKNIILKKQGVLHHSYGKPKYKPYNEYMDIDPSQVVEAVKEML